MFFLFLFTYASTSAATHLIPDSHFCRQFIKNGYKIDLGFNRGIGSDSSGFMVIKNNVWKLKVIPQEPTLRFVSKDSSITNGFDNYYMGLSGGADTLMLIDVSNDSFV